jgi:PDZ domain-containing protein
MGWGMKRRGITVLVGFLLVAGLTVLASQAPVPYVQLQPGPTFDTLGKDTDGKDVIEITGADSSSSGGQLRFVTIGVLKDLSLSEAVVGWLRHDSAVVPRELIYPPDQTDQQVEQKNSDDFANSESSAQTAAFAELGYPSQVKVKEVAAASPATGKLQVGDIITSVDGTAIKAPEALPAALQAKPAGTTFTIGFTRGGTPGTVQISTAASDDQVPRIGVSTEVVQTAPFKVNFPIQDIGGPSAGLMLTLGIIDKIKAEDLTGGKIIAGTGTIDGSGNVGPIGGVPQKLVASKDAGASFFLTPKDNCAEAVQNQLDGLPLVQVATLDDALTALADIRAGTTPPLCPGAK